MTGIFSFLIEPLEAILVWIQSVSGFSWGWSIVILTVFVRILLIPLGVKQYTSMRAMQKLQPKIKELQKKHKGDKQKLNEEMMKFYREHKVNPLGSCLPLLLQMPIFIALYLMLRDAPLDESIASLSWLWIDNITQPNNIIVFVYIGSQFVSSRLLSTATDKTQQMMMTVMPLFLGVIFLIYPFPAGVLIYWVTTNVWTIGQQLVTKRIVVAKEHKEEAEAAAKAAAQKKSAKKKTAGAKKKKTTAKKGKAATGNGPGAEDGPMGKPIEAKAGGGRTGGKSGRKSGTEQKRS